MKIRPRHVMLFLLLLLDLFLIPRLLTLPPSLKAYGFKPGMEVWKKELLAHPLTGPAILMRDTRARIAWLWLQSAIGAAVLAILWPPGRLRGKAKDLGGPEAAGRGQFGTARWRTSKEIVKTLTEWRCPERPPIGGFVVGAGNDRYFAAWLDASETHCLVIGATRSGKSRRIILPTIWVLAQTGESMIITAPKGELYHMTSGYLKRQGYEVVLIDLRQPLRGNRWNPLLPVVEAFKRNDMVEASQAAWDIAHIITHQYPHYGDPIWPQAQESLTAALTLAVADQAPEKARHLASAYRMLAELGAGGGEELDGYFRRLPQDHPARSAYGVAALSEDRLRSSIFTGTAAQLRLWADPEVICLTAAQDHDMALAGKTKAAVFIVIPDERQTRDVLATLYISQAYQALTDEAKKADKLPVRVNFLLDEFGNLPAIPAFDKKLTVAAGRGMRFLLAVQDLAQIKARYREASQTITANCATWVYLATSDIETAKVISAKTGQYTVATESYSSQVRYTDHSQGTTEALTGRPLLLPDEVLRWPRGEALILQIGQNPARLPLVDLSEWSVAGELKPSPDIDQDKEGVREIPPVWVPGKAGGEGDAGEPGQASTILLDL
ncbi:type IV secretion system protein VirD4 [Thermanaeromonas toyohensis ToBE]|uniref:Type IV secretion system protein VirD4 n=1 Tax=Thermanaeromonas toyohensis ToBE TaxID=698762 RepID=A0A1W1VRN9_9FIRM|nr:type IV secretory system conjugative DNA transfer family protein [Thermanaeromonas toyohensis]SMB95880.1 type IV secretion system protein VirD4 [Thermanaeromonas toyohensis ToBE]